MSGSMAPLKESVVFQNFILNAKNPILGFVIGILLCALAFCMPYFLAEQYAASAAESVSNAVETLGGISGL